jgi:hypothetical protein
LSDLAIEIPSLSLTEENSHSPKGERSATDFESENQHQNYRNRVHTAIVHPTEMAAATEGLSKNPVSKAYQKEMESYTQRSSELLSGILSILFHRKRLKMPTFRSKYSF